MMTRRGVLKAGLALGASVVAPQRPVFAQPQALVQKKIPSSGESLPVIGIGTARRYSAGPGTPERAELKDVLHQFSEAGGKVIDTAPSYGAAETVVGDLVSSLGIRPSLFIATKVRAEDRESAMMEIDESFRRLQTQRIDCIQVHNLVNTTATLAILREIKQAGRIRYVGITTSFEGQHAELADTMLREQLDFIQVNYAIDDRGAADRILPLAAERGVAVLVNLPLGRGRLFHEVQNHPLPAWASEFDCRSWAQFFLKYIVSHPAVTCAIPGTARTKYVVDNLGAARGRLPDAAMRKRMEAFIDKI
jgi:aryl-alcohol dehydrogenase-like predicted oxidoreductase